VQRLCVERLPVGRLRRAPAFVAFLSFAALVAFALAADPAAAQAPIAITYYLSEGATGGFFDEDVLIANPNNTAAPVTLTFSKENGEQVVATRSVPAQAHLTVHVDQIPGLAATSASAQVRSDSGLPLIVERSMFWDKTYYAGHTGSAVGEPAPDWFFAEGSQGFFETFVLVINPNATPADVTFTFFRENEPPVVKTKTVGAATRLTLHAGDYPELVTRSFGISVHATQPIMAERSMYFGTTASRLWSGGTESAGVTGPSTHWFLAEGATGRFFDTFVLLSNPQSTPAHVTLQYLLDTGETVTVPKTIAPNARLTTNIETEQDARLHNAAVSTVVTSDVPIIAERSMYWPGAAVPWGEGHNSFGVVDAGTAWGLAEGRVGGPLKFHTYILLANPQTMAANVTVRFLRETGATVVKTYTVPPTSRFNIDTSSVKELHDESFGTVISVTNGVPLIVERSMYWDSNGFFFSGGTNATGIRLAAAPGGCANLVQDPGFESGISGFEAQDASSAVTQSSDAPLEGSHSLRVAIDGYGNNVWWHYGFAGGLARHFSVSAQLRSDAASASQLQFCAMAYYADGSNALSCTPVSGSAGDKGVVSAALDLDPAKPLASVNIRLYQEGSAPVRFSLDSVTTCLDVVSAPPDGGGGDGGGGGGGGGGGTGSGCQAPTGPSAYPGFTYHLPTVRPFISLNDYTQVNPSSPTYARFKNEVDAAVGGNPPYAYSAVHSVIMYKLTGQSQYILDAIDRVEQQVQAAEAAIAAGGTPALAGDSYLDVGWYLEQLSLAYDYGYPLLTSAQRQRWASLADQAIYNVWNPTHAAWGGVAHTWSGWSICDPGNNYHYSFLRATMLWALATQNQTWLGFLQTQKFGPLVDYFAALPGGGSREGTGYGTALKNLFENYLYWKASTGEDLAGLTAHTRETIDYWVHATVPTRDRFAPIGDQSRVSIPDLYDYQENLVHAAVVLSASSDQARRGTWWLQNNSVNGVASSFNLAGDLLPYPATPAVPSALVYHATGAGVLFARSSWATDAAWLSLVAGKYDQSHAHHDQGAFTFFKGDWLSVTSNIWSHSGIHAEDEMHNVIRFVRTDGSTIPQNASSSVQSSMSYATGGGGAVTVAADLANAYSNNRSAILGWTRSLEFAGTVLRVHDVCSVASGVRPIFQLHVPVLPVSQPDGSILAGGLRIVPLQPVTASWTSLAGSEFSKGYRIELRVASGCEFSVELQAQ
jgi:hypothetical protein